MQTSTTNNLDSHSPCLRSRRRVCYSVAVTRMLADRICQAKLAMRRITSPARRRFANCRSLCQTSDGYAFSKVRQANPASFDMTDWKQAYTRASHDRKNEPQNPRLPARPSTTPRTSRTSSTNRYSTSSETKRHLPKRSAKRSGVMRSAMLRALSATSPHA